MRHRGAAGTIRRRRLAIASLAVLATLAAGCRHIQLVADYDASAIDEAVRLGKRVDVFYGNLIETDVALRSYTMFAAQWLDIEADLRGQVRRHAARPLNPESTAIAQGILDFWVQYRTRHKTSGQYTTGAAELDHARLVRLFNAVANAEAAKRMAPADRAPPEPATHNNPEHPAVP